jgi:hypothetical protein
MMSIYFIREKENIDSSTKDYGKIHTQLMHSIQNFQNFNFPSEMAVLTEEFL